MSFDVELPLARAQLEALDRDDVALTGDAFEWNHADCQLRVPGVVGERLTIHVPTGCSHVVGRGVARFAAELCGAAFDAATFEKRWSEENDAALKSIVREHPGALKSTLPRAAIDEAFEWNWSRQALQRTVGEELFIPRVFFFAIDGAVRRTVIWVDGAPIRFPEGLDLMVLHRETLAKNWMRAEPSSAVIAPGQVFETLGLKAANGTVTYAPEKLEEPLVRLFIDQPKVEPSGLKPLPAMHVIDAAVLGA